MDKKILYALAFLILIPLSYSFEFDNLKAYDPESRTVTIINAFGFGDRLADAKLLTPSMVYVDIGYQKVAEFEINSFSSSEEIIKKIEFYNLKNGRKELKNFDLKYWVKTGEEDIFIDIIKCTKYSVNNTCLEQTIEKNKIGIKEIGYWEKFGNKGLKSQERVGIFVDVFSGELIEWIPTIYGIKVDEWAVYGVVGPIAHNHTTKTLGGYSAGAKGGVIVNFTDAVNITGFDMLAGTFGGTSCYILDSGYSPSCSVNILATGTISGQKCSFNTGYEAILGRLYTLAINDVGSANYYYSDVPLPIDSGIVIWKYGWTTAIAEPCSLSTNIFSISNVTLQGSQSSIEVNLISPPNLNVTNSTQISFNWSINPISTTIKNWTFYLWNEDGSLNRTINASEDTTDFIYRNITQDIFIGNYIWNVLGCGDGSIGEPLCDWDINRTISIISWSYTQFADKNLIGEGTPVRFNLTIEKTNIPSTTAILQYNNTEYSPTTTTASENSYYFEKTITIPKGDGNSTTSLIQWRWKYTISGLTENQYTENQTLKVTAMNIDNCTSYATRILNFSIKDEANNQILDITGKTARIKIDLSLKSVDGSIAWNYNKSYNNITNFSVCVPTGAINNSLSKYSLYFIIDFSSDGYVQEFLYVDNATITYATIPRIISLMDLLLTDSTSFIVSYTDKNSLLVKGAIITLMRKYLGTNEFLEVESGKTNNDGSTILHFVEEDVIYKFNVTKEGKQLWESAEYRVYCTAGTACTISLLESGEIIQLPDLSNLPEGTYTLSANATSRIITLSFNLNQSLLMNLSVYKFSQNQTEFDKLITSNSTESAVGSLTLFVPQSYGNTTYYAVIKANENWVASHYINLKEKVIQIIGTPLASFIFSIIILTLALMSMSYGWGVIVFVLLGVILSSILQIIEIQYSTIIILVSAGLIIILKIASRRARE